jgi:prepilin-type N-terminal cleavage/methylation domain-containing protein
MPQKKQGFTLLELLIVVAIIAILAVIVIIILNPAETLRQTRDSQRLSDLSSLKTAVGLYTTATSTPYLAGATSNSGCKAGVGGGTWTSGDQIFYSLNSVSIITDSSLDNSTSYPSATQVAADHLHLTDGTGWIPINLDSLNYGSPISGLPIDPVNTIASLSNVAGTDLIYRYACNSTSMTFEIDAQLESNAYTSANDLRAKDGGNNNVYYEVGTNLKILGNGTDF